ncbi:hypothetical protein ACSSV8_000451 [Roseovarius sp. MBR-79]|jgi:hypothetical protein
MTKHSADLTADTSATAIDHKIWSEGQKPKSVGEFLTFAAKRSGLSPLHLGRDYMRHARSGRGIEITDYVNHQLWDKAMHPGDTADRFVGANTNWPISHSVNSRTWWAATEDKFMMQTILASAGIAMPRTLGVIDLHSARLYPGVTRITTPEALRELVLGHPPASLFAKTLDGMIGRGALVIEAATDTHLTVSGRAPVTWAQAIDTIFGTTCYLIQERIENHASLAPFCSGVPSVRLPAFITGDRVEAPMAALKLPRAGNVTCAYWRKENLACGIDPETGQINRVAGHDGPVTAALPDHPDRPGLLGLQLPFWDEVRAMHDEAVRVFGAIPYQSTDIAITPTGPVLIELNYAGSFDILQNATGKGFLQPEVRRFFASRDVNWTPAPRRGLLERLTRR